MPDALTTLIIILVAVAPGVLGEKFYRAVAGADWRADHWHRVTRVICVSLGGLIFYIMVAWRVGWSMPLYVIPTTFSEEHFTPELLPSIATTYAGHMLFAVVAGAMAGFAIRGVHRMSSASSYPDTWDVFVRDLVPGHWVAVTLTSEETYLGMVQKADISVKQSERDMVLLEPAQYDKERADYRSLPYQFLFIPGALIGSIAVYHDPSSEDRITPVNHYLFNEATNGQEDHTIEHIVT